MSYDAEQRRIIRLGRALSRGYSRRERMALFEAMRTEASFHSPDAAHSDRNSSGPLQQRPSTGWGPASESDATDIRQFLTQAHRLVQRGFRGGPGQLAQEVQHSAFPGRYRQHRQEAAALLGGAVSPSPVSGVQDGGGGAGSPGAATGRGRAGVLDAILHTNPSANPGSSASSPLFQALHQLGAEARPPSAPTPPGASASPDATRRPPGGGIRELFYDPLGAIKNGQRIAAIGGHEDHVHVALPTARAMVAAMRQARAMGLHVGENPFVGRVNPVHVEHSNHYRVLGKINGRRVGGAADVSGDPRKMAAFYRWVRRTF